MKYKVGDKVRVRSDLKLNRMYGTWHFIDRFAALRGKEVTIRFVVEYANAYFINESSGWFTDEMFEPVAPVVCIPKTTWRIIIEGDGKTTRAKYVAGKRVLKTSETRRHPDDTDNIYIAAKNCVDRLFPNMARVMADTEEKPEPKLYSGRVVCVESPSAIVLTIGKIYDVVNGELSTELGHTIRGVTSVENLNSRCKKGIKFIEIKE